MYGKQKSDNIEEISIKGGIPEIMEVILYADERSAPFTSSISRTLKGRDNEETFYNIWQFARKNVRYIEDKPGNEVIKSPGNLLTKGEGDCKSFSVLVGSILQNLQVPYFYRLIWEKPWVPNIAHVYVMAEIEPGVYFPIDPVNSNFGEEPFYYFFAKRDYHPAAAIGGLKISEPIPLFKALQLIKNLL